MNADDFELRLQRQPLRAPPPEWRVEILAAAQRQRSGRAGGPSPAKPGALGTARPTGEERRSAVGHGWSQSGVPLPGWVEQVRAWLWPHPLAWGALAACWAVVGVLNSAADAPLLASVRLNAGSTAFLATQAAEWPDVTGASTAPQRRPPASSPSPALPSPTSTLIRRHETQAV